MIMKLYTLIENQKKLEKAEVEIQMIPGIPQIHFLGLPDQAIKESFLRIKSAMKLSGFRFPTTQQIIVNIKPSYLKKSSKGLELAVVLGILHMTDQKILSNQALRSIIYGELSLNGEVHEPHDLIQYINQNPQDSVLSGREHANGTYSPLRISQINEDVQFMSKKKDLPLAIRPSLGLNFHYSQDESEILFLFATTHMHMLLSGPAGSGKTTLAKHSISFVDPKPQTPHLWPTMLAPHCSVTSAAFLGGGTQLYQGEIEKVQDGILFLDEFLEFDKDITEALRGPMTGEKLRLSRAGLTREFNCDFQVIGTSNLCPCGKWTPEVRFRNCRFSNRKCQACLEKLSGPVLDRFGIYFYYQQKLPPRNISGESILLRINHLRNKKDNLKTPVDQVTDLTDQLYPDISMRRKISLLKAARIYAIERESSTIELQDLVKAEKWTYSSFLEIERGMS
ncbi:MAG: ATP-binding protein [Moraxellaceae bacterium]|nr:ATP-binding protein [Pseudobdellovibrionaceae bacterium]